MTTIFSDHTPLSKKDFTIFHSLFLREVKSLLPVDGSVVFWKSGGNQLPDKELKKLFGKTSRGLASLCVSLKPAATENTIILPLEVQDGDNVAVIAREMDSGLLRRMAPEWLREFRGTVQKALCRIKQSYVYPESGMYNSRVLEILGNGTGKIAGAFFLLGTPERAKRSTRGFLKIIKTGHLIEATVHGPVIYFGGNVFCIFQENMDRDSALRFARWLLGRFKREGMPSIHIGIGLLQGGGDESLSQLLDKCWQALEIAERRGPFSLCETSYLYDRQGHPLAPPAPETVKRLQKKWRGHERFSLLLVRVEDDASIKRSKKESLDQTIRDVFKDRYVISPVHSSECYVLLPGVSFKKAEQVARRIKKGMDMALEPFQVAVGISYWPCQEFYKTAAIMNCRKALMHGDFFGPGSITVFDHVSLNVSGDYFFDEGDYRQAVKDYRAGLKMNPDEVNLLNSLGVTLAELNKLGEALHYFDLALEKEPRNFMALVNKGFAQRMLKKDDQAIECLVQAQKCRESLSSPVNTDVSLQLGRLYCETKQYKKAVRILEKIVSRNSEWTGYLLYSLLGEAYAATGKNSKGIEMLQKAVKLNPHDARSMSILGELYAVEGEGDEIALSLCNRALNLDELSWDSWYRLAKVLYKLKDYDKSEDAVHEALQRNRKAVDAIFLAGKIKAKHGKVKQAIKLYQDVLRISPDFPGGSRALKQIRKQVQKEAVNGKTETCKINK